MEVNKRLISVNFIDTYDAARAWEHINNLLKEYKEKGIMETIDFKIKMWTERTDRTVTAIVVFYKVCE